jgi:GNAT superfamily N-acetyltransferase
MTERLLPWDPDRQMAMIQQVLEGGNMRLIVFDGERAGWMETQEDNERIYLAHIYIRLELQRRGIGTCALNALIRRAGDARKSLTCPS